MIHITISINCTKILALIGSYIRSKCNACRAFVTFVNRLETSKRKTGRQIVIDFPYRLLLAGLSTMLLSCFHYQPLSCDQSRRIETSSIRRRDSIFKREYRRVLWPITTWSQLRLNSWRKRFYGLSLRRIIKDGQALVSSGRRRACL